ncbi:MAG: hypothetical protein V2A79_05005 [Planctomycetota bacterium]
MPSSDADPELERLADGRVSEAALRKAVRRGLRRHKLLGNPVAEWRDGRVVWIPPTESEIEPEPEEDVGHPDS